MNIELPEVKELSEKLDRVIRLLEHMTGSEERRENNDRVAPMVTVRRSMSAAQIAEYLGIDCITVYKMVSARRIPFYKVGRRVLFDADQINRWIKKNSRRETG